MPDDLTRTRRPDLEGRHFERAAYDRQDYLRGDYGRGGDGAHYRPAEPVRGGRGATGRTRGFFGPPGEQGADTARGPAGGTGGGTDHRGRGPRGYRRSDARISEDLHDRLTDDPHLDASAVTVQVSGGEVTLYGNVDSREAKRRAEDIAHSVSGVTHVQNNLRIRQQPRTSTEAGYDEAVADPRGSNILGRSAGAGAKDG